MINLIALTILALSIIIPSLMFGVLYLMQLMIRYKEKQKYRRDLRRGLNPNPWSNRK